MSKTILVLLPGLDGTGELFQPFLSVVPVSQRTHVMFYPNDRILGYSDLLEFIERQLSVERAMVLVAESFSGPLALRYAAKHPDRVRAVVLCASFVRPPLPKWLRGFVRPFMFRISPPDFVVRRLMIGRDAPKPLVKAVKHAARQVMPAVLSRRLQDVLEVNCADELQRCAAPILDLAASHDVLVRSSSVDAIRAINAHVRVVEIDGPHLLLQRQPAAAWREIERFLVAETGSEDRV
jgi:pimeloyl-[acyl-carrier protein] methyl ester esterase